MLLPKVRVLTADISLGGFQEHIHAFAELGAAHRSAYVCCVNAHMTVEARSAAMAKVLQEADMATADGMPVLRALQLLHGVQQERVAGNDILPALLAEAEKRGLSVYFYGGQESVLKAIEERIGNDHPALRVAGFRSPPFRPLSDAEMQEEAGSHQCFRCTYRHGLPGLPETGIVDGSDEGARECRDAGSRRCLSTVCRSGQARAQMDARPEPGMDLSPLAGTSPPMEAVSGHQYPVPLDAVQGAPCEVVRKATGLVRFDEFLPVGQWTFDRVDVAYYLLNIKENRCDYWMRVRSGPNGE